MTQEEKELLLKDLCARLPYGVICKSKSYRNILFNSSHISLIESEEIKPYLRLLSSMTEDEKETYQMFFNEDGLLNTSIDTYLDWLLEGHFDFRGLISKGLTVEAPENFYNN